MKIIQGKLANFSKKFNDVVNVNVNNIVDLTNKDNLLVSMAMLQHTPQITELFKFGSHNYNHLRQFKAAIEQTLFTMPVARDRALTYRAEEMQVQMQDEYYCELNTAGIVQYHKARVRLFLLSFLNGNPVVEIGINDRTREGKEVVGRNDIMPISTEEWIRVEDVEFHHCVEASAFQADDKLVKLVPPDACTIEVMRFRVRPSRNRELPLIVSARMILSKCSIIIAASFRNFLAPFLTPFILPAHRSKKSGTPNRSNGRRSRVEEARRRRDTVRGHCDKSTHSGGVDLLLPNGEAHSIRLGEERQSATGQAQGYRAYTRRNHQHPAGIIAAGGFRWPGEIRARVPFAGLEDSSFAKRGPR